MEHRDFSKGKLGILKKKDLASGENKTKSWPKTAKKMQKKYWVFNFMELKQSLNDKAFDKFYAN